MEQNYKKTIKEILSLMIKQLVNIMKTNKGYIYVY